MKIIQTLKNDRLIVIALYLITFGIITQYVLTHPIMGDGIMEFETYLINVDSGWTYDPDNILNSCLVTTWLPAEIHKVTGWDIVIVFKMVPVFLYSLMIPFIYMICRRYLSVGSALICSAVILANSHFLFFPAIGRVGVAIALLSGLVWALLEKRYVWAFVFAGVIVFTHYGTMIIVAGLLLSVCIGVLIFRRKLRWQYLAIIGVMMVMIVSWHFVFAGASGKYIFAMFRDINKVPANVIVEGRFETIGEVHAISMEDILDLNVRDPVTQEAFGLNFGSMNAPQRIELIFNWLVVLFICLGLLKILLYRKYELDFRLMQVAMFALIFITLLLPWLSMYYGVQRVYFTSSAVLAVCFVDSIWSVTNTRIS